MEHFRNQSEAEHTSMIVSQVGAQSATVDQPPGHTGRHAAMKPTTFGDLPAIILGIVTYLDRRLNLRFSAKLLIEPGRPNGGLVDVNPDALNTASKTISGLADGVDQWQLLHGNDAAQKLTGLKSGALLSKSDDASRQAKAVIQARLREFSYLLFVPRRSSATRTPTLRTG